MRYRGGQGSEALPLGGIYSRRMEDYLRYHGRAIFIEDALNRLLAGQSFEAALELVASRLGRKEVSRLNLVKAELLHRLGRDVEAREECQRILGAYDADPDVWALLGWLEIAAGRSHLSRSLFERALALEPAHAVSLVNTAYFDDPLFASVTAPVDVLRHQDYMRTGLSFGGRPSPYGQAVAGDSL